MATKILSWNVQKLGMKHQFQAKFVASVIITPNSEADIVGLMEVQDLDCIEYIKTWIGNLSQGLIAHGVVPGPVGDWNSFTCKKQVGSPYEQSSFIWNESNDVRPQTRMVETSVTNSVPNVVETSAFWQKGIVDPRLFEFVFNFGNPAQAWNAAQVTQFYLCLKAQGLIRKLNSKKYNVWRVTSSGWANLRNKSGKGVVQNVGGSGAKQVAMPFNLTRDQLDGVGIVLWYCDVIRFVTDAKRFPLMGWFEVGPVATARQLLACLYHAPYGNGSGYAWDQVQQSINTLAMMPELVDATNMLLMGDFNFSVGDKTRPLPIYTRNLNSGTFGVKSPVTSLDLFQPITAAPKQVDRWDQTCAVGAAQQMAGVGTSIGPLIYSDNTPPDDILINDYDHFYYRPEGLNVAVDQATNQPKVRCRNLICEISPNGGNYEPWLARLAYANYMSARGTHDFDGMLDDYEATYEEKEDEVDAKVAALNAYQKLPNPNPNRVAALRAQAIAAQNERDKAEYEYDTIDAYHSHVHDPNNDVVSGNGMAGYMYNHAFSDHMPIEITLEP